MYTDTEQKKDLRGIRPNYLESLILNTESVSKINSLREYPVPRMFFFSLVSLSTERKGSSYELVNFTSLFCCCCFFTSFIKFLRTVLSVIKLGNTSLRRKGTSSFIGPLRHPSVVYFLDKFQDENEEGTVTESCLSRTRNVTDDEFRDQVNGSLHLSTDYSSEYRYFYSKFFFYESSSIKVMEG